MIRQPIKEAFDHCEGDHCKADFGESDVAVEKREQTHNRILSFRPTALIAVKWGNPKAQAGRVGDLPFFYETNRFDRGGCI
jgi:hypothetical protein